MKKLSRIHYNPNRKSGKVEIEIVDERSDSLVDVTTLKSNDLPRPELDRALQDMRPHLMDLCELPDEWEDDVTILGVSAGYKDGTLGLTITAKRDFDGSNSPLNINAPRFWEEHMGKNDDDVEESDIAVLSPQCKDDFKRLERLVFAYLNGERQQLPLNFKSPEGGHSSPLPLEADPVSS